MRLATETQSPKPEVRRCCQVHRDLRRFKDLKIQKFKSISLQLLNFLIIKSFNFIFFLSVSVTLWLILFNISLQAQVNWIMEDPSSDNGWDYSVLWQGDGDVLGFSSQYSNVLINTKEVHSGKTSLELKIKHTKKGYCGVWIPTGLHNKGVPPSSWEEANQGKDIHTCDTLEFWIKAKGKSRIKDIKIEIVDENDLYTDKLILSDYHKPGGQWKKIQIRLDEFNWAPGFDKKRVKGISFLVEQDIPQGIYSLYIDDVRFIKKGIQLMKRFKIIFEDNSVLDKAWNFSGTCAEIDPLGTVITLSSYHNNISITRKESYKGYSCMMIPVKHRAGGQGCLYFTGHRDGLGVPPDSWADFDTPKDISKLDALRFFVKAKGKKPGGKLKIGDLNSNTTEKIDLTDFVDLKNKWQEVLIPFEMIEWGKCDKKKIKEFKYQIDDDFPPGEFTIYFDNIEFISISE